MTNIISRFFLFTFLFTFACLTGFAADGDLDTTFNAQIDNGNVFAVAVQSNGKIIVGGDFTTIGGVPRNGIARLNADGSLDTSFDPGSGVASTGAVVTIAIQEFGNILIGGGFTSYNGTQRSRIARINPDGSLDGGFTANADGTVTIITINPTTNRIMVGGAFTAINGFTRQKIAEFNNSGALTAFVVNFNFPIASNVVRGIAFQPDGKIMINGLFDILSGSDRRLHLARLNGDGTLDPTFTMPVFLSTASAGGLVKVQPDGRILAAVAHFDTGKIGIARYSATGVIDSSFNTTTFPNISNTVFGFNLQGNSKIVIGGSFTAINGTPRGRLARLNSDGTLDAGFSPSVDGNVFAVTPQTDGNILIAGNFLNANSAARSRIARFRNERSTLTVTKTADTNDGICNVADCSLREAIAVAASGDVIEFASPLFDSPQTIGLTIDRLVINKSLTINGKGAQLLTVRNASPATDGSERFGIFEVSSGKNSTISGMTIKDGRAGGSNGGGIQNYGGLTVIGCYLSNNGSSSVTNVGPAIRNDVPGVLDLLNTTIANSPSDGLQNFVGGITITNSTFSNNGFLTTGSGSGGLGSGFYNFSGSVTVTNSTFTNNANGGINRGGGVVTVRSTLIANNPSSITTDDVRGVSGSPTGNNHWVSGGYNMIGRVGSVVDFVQVGDLTNALFPLLGPLADNGGPTPTHALQPGSPAIDKGKSFGSTTDQRGSPRPVDDPGISPAPGGDNSDIGAFEFSLGPPANVNVSGRVTTPDGRGLRNATVKITDANNVTRFATTSSFGFYSFDNVATGQSYTIAISSRLYRFQPRVVQVTGDLTGVDFVGQQ